MSNGLLAVTIIATALTSILGTLVLRWIVLRHRLRPPLETRLLESLQTQVRSGLEEAATELLSRFCAAPLTAEFQESCAGYPTRIPEGSLM